MAGAAAAVPRSTTHRAADVIIVTLGTHPQPMDRLRRPLEEMVRALPHRGPFIAQLGPTASPEGWLVHRLMGGGSLRSLIHDADIVITHGGPATIGESRASGKIPIVVPRRSDRGEHVDDHQLHYCRRLAEAAEILLVEDEETLVPTVHMYESLMRPLPPPKPHDPTAAIAAVRRIGDKLMKNDAYHDRRR